MVLELLILFVCIVIGGLLGKKIHHAVERHDRKQLGARRAVDAEGYPLKYDPHYTRQIEFEQGLKVETKCDDPKCQICQWKIRNLYPVVRHPNNVMDFVHKKYQETLNEFIRELPDGMSDDYYNMVFEDFERETEEKFRSQIKEIEQAEEEKYYATPRALIEKYKAEGRVFNKANNSWSSPKAMLGRGPLTLLAPSPLTQKIIDANKKHWRKRHPDAKPREIKVKVSSNTIVIADFEQWMRHSEQQEAGKRALASGAKAREESKLLLLKAQMLEDKEAVARYKDEIKMFEQNMKEIKQKMREWERSVQRNIRI